MDSQVHFFVNGNKIVITPTELDRNTTLLHFLRRNLRLTGCKEGCGEGGCGTCTVMISKYEQDRNVTRHWSVNACITPLCTLDGLAVTTIEGIGSTRILVHPCQESIACGHGSQCGFCTPGMIMSMFTLLHNNLKPSELDIEEALHGNLCRCTGYRPILDSFNSLCKSKFNNKKSDDDNELDLKLKSFKLPSELMENVVATPLCISGSKMTWHRPISLEQLFALKEDIPDSKLVAGGISLGLHLSKQATLDASGYIALSSISELSTIKETEEGLLIGAMVTIGELEKQLKERILKLPGSRVKRLEVMLEMLTCYAGPQIKNVATVGGNIMYPSSDIMTVLVAINATAKVISKDAQRELVFNSTNKTLQLANTEVLMSVMIPMSEKYEHIAVFKQTRRRYLDSSIVNACLWIKLSQDENIIEECHLVYGGIANNGPSVPVETEWKMVGKKFKNELLSMVCNSLTQELAPDDTNMRDYKINLCLSFFFKFYLQVLSRINETIPSRDRSAIKKLPRQPIKGVQGFQRIPNQQSVIGQPLMHCSALEQATGEARYVNDMPFIDGEGYAGLILSEAAHAFFDVDFSGLEEIEGILGYVSAKDVSSSNITGLGNDELLFADKKVTSVGQLIAIVVAKSKIEAQRAVQAVKVEYTHLPAILTFEEAIAQKSFYKPGRYLKNGNVEDAFVYADYVKEGEMRIGGQEQFYMETFACLAIPKGEHNEIELIASTQNLSECQCTVARALGIPNNRVKVKITRLGGGFGGKETRCNIIYGAVAVAANKLNIPVRMKMSREQDMVYSGTRHPFLGKYKVGFSKEGKLEALDIDIYLNGGYSEDLSVRVMEGAILNAQSVYYIPNVTIRGYVCCTNLPSNTAMRGFGTPEALMIMETIVSHVSDTLNMEKVKIQELNFLKNGQEFVYGMKVKNSTIQRCMTALLEKSSYYQRKREIDEFNKDNHWKKRGIALVPTLHGMGFYEYLPLNQTGALIHVYTDGSVLLTHGGIEMGQGLHTKMIQVCAKCLNIPIEKIHISETSTDKVPNMIPTSASVSTDYNGMAVQDACQQILQEMKPFMEDKPDGTWEEWVEAAYTGRVSLSATGYFKTPEFGITFNDDGCCSKGDAYLYHTYGVACSIVEVDTLTGTSQVLRSDLLMDVGDSINPAIDIGQVEGAFTQGLGLFTMEELIFSTDGQLQTNGPNTYKIPGFGDVPIELNVSLLDRCPNPKAIFSSKGIGEPPLFLAASVFFAIKEAVKSARADNGINADYFEFHSPATVERIRLACQD